MQVTRGPGLTKWTHTSYFLPRSGPKIFVVLLILHHCIYLNDNTCIVVFVYYVFFFWRSNHFRIKVTIASSSRTQVDDHTKLINVSISSVSGHTLIYSIHRVTKWYHTLNYLVYEKTKSWLYVFMSNDNIYNCIIHNKIWFHQKYNNLFILKPTYIQIKGYTYTIIFKIHR